MSRMTTGRPHARHASAHAVMYASREPLRMVSSRHAGCCAPPRKSCGSQVMTGAKPGVKMLSNIQRGNRLEPSPFGSAHGT
jgi:hypothetical protein